eukprot:gene15555-17782_t
MDLFNHLLGAEGCNVDGTVGSNPFTSLVDNMFETQFLSGGAQFQSSSDGVYFAEEGGGQSITANAMQNNSAMSSGWHQQSSMHSSGFAMPMYPPSPMMYPTPFMNPFQMQSNHTAQQSENSAVYEDEGDYDEYEEYETRYEYAEEGEQQYEHVETLGVTATTEDNLQTADGPSQQGYDNAWDDLKNRLESGTITGVVEAPSYQFVPAEQNPYVNAETQRDFSKLMEEGMALFRAGKVKQAILCFESIVQDSAGSQHDEAWRMLGACHAENDEDKRAIHCLNTALDCDPYNLEALLALGTSYVNELNSIKALETLRTW